MSCVSGELAAPSLAESIPKQMDDGFVNKKVV